MASSAFTRMGVFRVRTTLHSVKQHWRDITVSLSNFLVKSNAEEFTRTTWTSDKMVISILNSGINRDSNSVK